jgi:hypothetical protein
MPTPDFELYSLKSPESMGEKLREQFLLLRLEKLRRLLKSETQDFDESSEED